MPLFFINVARAVSIPNPLGPQNQTVADIIKAVTGAFQIFAGGVATVMVLWGAFKILTAGGDPKKYEAGKHTIIYAAIGLAIVFLAGGVVTLVADILGKSGIETNVERGSPRPGFNGPIRGIDFPISPPGPRPA